MAFTGSKYVSGLGSTEIAKLIRADIKAAIKAGELPIGLKTSVTKESYAGGSSITVRVVEVPGLVLHNPEVLDWHAKNPNVPSHLDRYTAEGRRVLEALKEIVTAYKYDDSDSMTDYYHVNFSDSVIYDWEYIEARRMWETAHLAELLGGLAAKNAKLAAAKADKEAIEAGARLVAKRNEIAEALAALSAIRERLSTLNEEIPALEEAAAKAALAADAAADAASKTV